MRLCDTCIWKGDSIVYDENWKPIKIFCDKRKGWVSANLQQCKEYEQIE